MSNKSMKLFFLRYGKGGDFVIDESTGEPAHFHNKKIAKLHRKDNMIVTYGSDHKKFKGGLIYASKKRNNKNYEGS